VTPEETTALVQSLQDNSERLGLTWEIRLGTVTDNSPIRVQFDSDTGTAADASGVTTMIGPVYVGQRVYVISVPPAGNYIIGTATTTQLGVRARVSNSQTVNNASQTTLIWNSIDEESGGDYIAPNGTVFTIRQSGLWALHLRISLFAAGGARNFLNFNVTTTIPNVFPSNIRANFSAGDSNASLSTTIPMLTGDTFNASVYQEGGANSVNAYLTAFRVGAYSL
jgi:hypothetical protein